MRAQKTVVYLDSDKRVSGTLESPTIEITPWGMTKLKSWRIKGVWIPFSYYVFNSTSNQITFSEGGPPITITLANGTYDTSSLAAEITLKMNAATTVGNVYTVSFSGVSFQCNIGTVGPSTAFILNPTAANSALYYLGWQYSSATASATVQRSPYAARLGGPSHIYVRSSALNTILFTTSFRSMVADRIICDIPCTSGPGGAQVLNVGPLEKYPCNGSLGKIDFELLDERGLPLGGATGLNGVPWNISIIFKHLPN